MTDSTATGSAAGAPMPRISLLAAVAENGVIGRDNDLPWRLPADLRRVKQLTVGHTIIMGRRTYESIGRPLPRRRTLVLSRDPSRVIEGVEVVGDWPTALAHAREAEEIFVFGGAEVFRQALPVAQRLFLTVVHAEVEGDVRFPTWNEANWTLIEDERFTADARHDHDYSFRLYARRPVAAGDG